MHSDSELTARLLRAERTPRDAFIAVVACVCAVLLVFWPTTVSMISIWYRSETFAHGFLVIPMFLFLVWRKREELATVTVRPCLPALIGVLAAGALWTLGELSAAIVVSQFGMMLIVPFGIWAILGTGVVSTLALPLAFLFFAVPFGEALVPKMMDWTADFTVRALALSGVPVYREGNYFMIPSGRWSVVEACSGLRYLIASVMVGCLYAMLVYRSAWRRVTFIAVAIVVPVVANWIRAYGIVMLAHLTDNRLATGIDHVIYGWLFFGLVMLLLFWLGSLIQEAPRESTVAVGSAAPATPARADRRPMLGTAALALLAASVWPVIARQLDAAQRAPNAEPLSIGTRGGWTEQSRTIADWTPDISGASVVSRRTFTKDGMDVAVDIELFPKQTLEARAVTSTNELVRSTTRQRLLIHGDDVNRRIGRHAFRARSAVIAGPAGRLLAWQWYWIDGRSTTSDYAAKLYQILSKLEMRGDPTAWVIIYTPLDEAGTNAPKALRAFVRDMGPSIDAALARTADQ